jgi:hypothetical protein
LYHADQQFKEAAKMTGMDAGVYGIKKRNGHDSNPKKYKGVEKRGSLNCWRVWTYFIKCPQPQARSTIQCHEKEDFKNIFQAQVRDTKSLSRVHVADYEDISLDLNLF